ncbi:MAG TPA: outer membrane beta-barrel domain-containing protein [Steroidobacteraceae bacterium]|nr:outer membrane beta-barrel domain-containing protein [Steroidobacteraceae bacterium]
MEIRLGGLFLAAALLATPLLSGCAWFHRGSHRPVLLGAASAPAGAEGRTAGGARNGEIIEPQVTRRVVKTPKIKSSDFELGPYFGALSIQDFGTNPVYGARLAYHVTNDVFMEGYLGRSTAGTTSLQDVFPNITILSNSGKQFTYYDLDVGYDVLPGEVYLGRGRAFNTALYTTLGMGDVKFADKDQFALNFGVGERILITDWLAMHMDVRDHIFETDLTGRTKNVDNIEATLGFTVFY